MAEMDVLVTGQDAGFVTREKAMEDCLKKIKRKILRQPPFSSSSRSDKDMTGTTGGSIRIEEDSDDDRLRKSFVLGGTI